ncbi:alpha-amylase family protein [Tessaracoccus defluvii]|uniref:Glycoside hydrolase family 42 N-terminal domain-containing protein n=1 Tax=Tessaracoccus defluvii TaxID=1285901 RepID=A0A7H0H4G9_9ACTN|nr:hypothetical protein [Tessaracoccus defluvii]QNP55435.1 hypothetical protein H9L22_14700 [Tessaracoccus defluvii]
MARAFRPGDGLDYPGDLPGSLKCFTMINERLIALQEEYARELLCHVNPYTGLALIDDPAVMTVQINNEDSVIKGTAELADDPAVRPYRDELRRRFNDFLLERYGSREGLREAWTFEGVCALGVDEDPVAGTVSVVEGGFFQPVNEPMGPWDGEVSPARYADWMAFGIEANRSFYRRMKDFLVGIGVRVPIATSNLVAGAADVFGHSDADIMENNAYFNHPLLPYVDNTYVVGGLADYVATNPLTMQKDAGPLRTTLLSLGSTAVIAGKPFALSEWNEYGAAPFHATAAVHTTAYACLNNWDALILYCHHTSEDADDQPDDEILNLFDAYNDVALISQWGFMAALFLKGLVAPAPQRADLVYTAADLLTLPTRHAMPHTFLPYVLEMRSVFLTEGDSYDRDADVAVTAGFMAGADLGTAPHRVRYAWSPYADPHRRELAAVAPESGGRTLDFADISEVAGGGDYRGFAAAVTKALTTWNVIPAGTGFVEERLVSSTGELDFDPDNARFSIDTPSCAYFSGAPTPEVRLGQRIRVESANERMSLALLPLDAARINDATELLLTAVGKTGMDETTYTPVDVYPGFEFTAVKLAGKVAADTLAGVIHVSAHSAELVALDPHGDLVCTIPGVPTASGTRFDLAGDIPAVNYHLTLG